MLLEQEEAQNLRLEETVYATLLKMSLTSTKLETLASVEQILQSKEQKIERLHNVMNKPVHLVT